MTDRERGDLNIEISQIFYKDKPPWQPHFSSFCNLSSNCQNRGRMRSGHAENDSENNSFSRLKKSFSKVCSFSTFKNRTFFHQNFQLHFKRGRNVLRTKSDHQLLVSSSASCSFSSPSLSLSLSLTVRQNI